MTIELFQLLNLWRCNVKKDSIKIDSLMDKLRKGDEGKSGGIVLLPDYQRHYKFTTRKESSIIESILLNIPIPTIYLSQNTLKEVVFFNVIDGRHRLEAIQRFIEGKYKLTGLKILRELNGKSFEKLPVIFRNMLLYDSQIDISSIDTSQNPELEYEVFLRFNQETNPLRKQELLEVLFRSDYATWFKTELVKELIQNKGFRKMFNDTGKRRKDKTLNYSVYAFLAYFTFGLIEGKNDTPIYVSKFMKMMVGLDEVELLKAQDNTKKLVYGFVNFYTMIAEVENINQVISKEFINKKSQQGSHVFLISFLIPLTLMYKYLLEIGWLKDEMDIYEYKIIYEAIKRGMLKVGFGEFGGVSSTSYKVQYACYNEMKKCIEQVYQ
ncbi:DUF262 domain-containing protein [Paenibacillus taichungensis]|uniref:DUF262 domain-containing protein n=1 Tax=Paenibacillus taichungensis TaxID=484184 RepID=UPI0038087038